MSHAGLSIASWRPFADARARRRAALIAASTVLHIAILAPLAVGLFRLPDALPLSEPPLIFVEMEPRPLLDGEVARAPTLAARDPETQRPLTTVVPLPAPLRDEDEEDQPSTPNPRVGAAPQPGAPPAPADAWQVTPEGGMAAAVSRSLRTGAGGCRIMDGNLSLAEQRLCDERFNEAAGRASPVGPRTLTPSEERQEAQRQADAAAVWARNERRGRPPSANPPAAVISPDCPGGNLRGTCAGAHLRPGFEMTDERLRNNRKFE